MTIDHRGSARLTKALTLLHKEHIIVQHRLAISISFIFTLTSGFYGFFCTVLTSIIMLLIGRTMQKIHKLA